MLDNMSKNPVSGCDKRAIENRCKIIIDRNWPQQEIDDWLALLSGAEREYAIALLPKKRSSLQENSCALTDEIEWPKTHEEWLRDAEFTRDIWRKVDDDKLW